MESPYPIFNFRGKGIMSYKHLFLLLRSDAMKRAFTFDDVSLVPQFNNVPSRTEPLLETWLTKNRKMHIPLICANMDTAISEELADILIAQGSMPIFHRFTPIETQLKWVKKKKEKTIIFFGFF